MRILFIAIITLFFTVRVTAQSCKIKIFYDANGNRVQRVLECEGGRPAGDQVVARSEQKQVNGFGNLTEGTYQVYPNPAQNKVSIKLDAALLEKGCSIVMTDILGKMIFLQKDVQQAVSEIDLHGLTDGAYLIQIISGTDHHTVKIVKQTGNGY
jgi:hypothetical protein